jgi:hypothetical protein
LAAIAFEKRIRNASVENAALFQPDGTLLAQATGVADEVEFPKAALSVARGATLTHNHPRGTGPSLRDVVCGITWKLLEVRVVAGDYTYAVDQLDGVAIIALRAAYDHEFQRQEPLIVHDIQQCKLHPMEFEAELLHRIWTRVSRQLSFQYRREP